MLIRSRLAPWATACLLAAFGTQSTSLTSAALPSTVIPSTVTSSTVTSSTVEPSALPSAAASSAAPDPTHALLQDPERGTIGGLIQCGPGWVQIDAARRIETPYPVAKALEFAGPGALIELQPGDYPPLMIGFKNQDPSNARTVGGQPGLPITIRGRGEVRFKAQGRGDTIGITQQFPVGHISFEKIVIEAGTRSAVMFYDLADRDQHTGFRFYDCGIDGGWDHLGGTGNSSKWGILGHDLADFVFAGREGRAFVRDVRLEHAFYLQSPRGDITLENIDAKRLGRCFMQITARERSGPPGRGLIVVRGNNVSDTGLSEWDDYKGGTAYTLAGGLQHCTILIENNTYKAGFDQRLRRLTRGGAPYGTGALVAWDGGEKLPNGSLVLRSNEFRFAEGCGDRATVAISACERVVIEEDNVFQAGAFGVALELEPQYSGDRPGPKANGRIFLAEGTELVGELRIAAVTATAEQRVALAVPFGER